MNSSQKTKTKADECIMCGKPRESMIFGGTLTDDGHAICFGWCQTWLEVDLME